MNESPRADTEEFFVGKRRGFAGILGVFQKSATHFRRKITDSCRRRICSLITYQLLLGGQQANQHLADGGAGIGDGLFYAANTMESIAGVENGLNVSSLQGHFALENVVDGFQGVCAIVAAAAGNEIGNAGDHLAAFDFVGAVAIGVEQTGAYTFVVAGSGVGVDSAAFNALGSLDQILCHEIKLPFVSFKFYSNIQFIILPGNVKHSQPK